MKKANRIVSYDWTKYDQGHVVYRPAQMSGPELRVGLEGAYSNFYSASSMASRFPLRGKRHRAQWLIYNLFMRRATRTDNISWRQRRSPTLRQCLLSCPSSANGARPCSRQPAEGQDRT
jgi:hypothetical protein